LKDSKEEARHIAMMRSIRNATYDKMEKQKTKNWQTEHKGFGVKLEKKK